MMSQLFPFTTISNQISSLPSVKLARATRIPNSKPPQTVGLKARSEHSIPVDRFTCRLNAFHLILEWMSSPRVRHAGERSVGFGYKME